MPYEIGEEIFDEAKMLEWLFKLMKTYPNLTARDILWSLFIPNDKAMIEAQERGRPENVTEVIAEILSRSESKQKIEETDIEPVKTLGLYKLQLCDQEEKFKKNKNYPHATVMVVMADNHGDARRMCAERCGQYSDGSRKHGEPWLRANKSTCTLIARVSEKIGWRSVIFAGRNCKGSDYY